MAVAARITRSTASEHLTKMVKARLVSVTQKRRNRYYRIASPLVAKTSAIDMPASCSTR